MSSLVHWHHQQGYYIAYEAKQEKGHPRNQPNSRQVKHTPPSHQMVTCTVDGGEGRDKLRPATVQLPNSATFGELLEQGRQKRYGALEFEGPVYGQNGELDITLRDAWVRNGCKIDGTRHIGLAVVVSFPLTSRKPLPLVMGPGDTINDVKRVSPQPTVFSEVHRAPNHDAFKLAGIYDACNASFSRVATCVSNSTNFRRRYAQRLSCFFERIRVRAASGEGLH